MRSMHFAQSSPQKMSREPLIWEAVETFPIDISAFSAASQPYTE